MIVGHAVDVHLSYLCHKVYTNILCCTARRASRKTAWGTVVSDEPQSLVEGLAQGIACWGIALKSVAGTAPAWEKPGLAPDDEGGW